MLTVDGTDIQDWVAAGAFSSFGAVGLLATRTEAPSTEPAVLRASAYLSLGASAAVGVRPGERPAGRHGGAVAGLLGEALAREGMLATAIGDASGNDLADAPAGLGAMRLDGTTATGPARAADAGRAPAAVSRADANSPGGRRTDPEAVLAAVRGSLSWATLIVVDLGDAARADRAFTPDPAARGPWVGRALDEADAIARSVRAMLRPGDTLVVASLVPPLARERSGIHLGAVAFAPLSPELIRGTIRSVPISGTTRQGGVIALSDLAPTFLRDAGVEPPAEMQGRTVRFIPSGASSARTSAARLDSDLARAVRSRRPLTRIWLVASAALSVAAFLTIAAGRGAAPGRERLPRRWRDMLGVGLLAAAATPGAFLLAPAIAGASVASVGWWTLVIAAGSALVARVTLGHERGLAAIALAVAALFVGDLALGSPLAARSAIGFLVAGGGRFYGVDEGMLGVLLAAPLVAAGLLLDRIEARRRVLIASVLGLALVAFLAGAPAFGSKFGAPFTLVPAFGVFVVLAAGRRIDRVSTIGIAIATALLSATLAAADALASPEASSHIGREISGRTPAGALVVRKLTSLVKITATTVWLPVTIVIAGTAALLFLRRRDLLGRAMWGKPARRAALWASCVGAIFAMGSNDTGIITVAAAAPIVAATFYGALLTPEQGDP